MYVYMAKMCVNINIIIISSMNGWLLLGRGNAGMGMGNWYKNYIARMAGHIISNNTRPHHLPPRAPMIVDHRASDARTSSGFLHLHLSSGAEMEGVEQAAKRKSAWLCARAPHRTATCRRRRGGGTYTQHARASLYEAESLHLFVFLHFFCQCVISCD